MAIYVKARGHLVDAETRDSLETGATIKWDANKGTIRSKTAPIGSYDNAVLYEDDNSLRIKAEATGIDPLLTFSSWELQVRDKDNNLVGTFTSNTNPSHRSSSDLGWEIYSLISSSYSSSRRASLDFYAYFIVDKATLTYDANGGSGAPEPETHKIGEFTISSVEPTRSGYTFLGWATSSSASSAEYQAGDLVTITEDTTLYAVWTQLPTFTITVVSAGNGSVYGGGEYIVGSTALLTTAPAMGYVFDRWNDGDTSPERAVVVSADATYTAYFRRNWISVDQYEFVTGRNIDADHPHGDLDRIIIDGDIMPLRTGVSPTTGVERKRILRGEDIAYLWECIGERTAVMDMTRDFMWAPVLEFKRRLDDYQLLRIMNWVRTFPREIVSHFVTYSTTLIKDSPFPTTTVVKDKGEYDWGLPPDFLDTFPEVELLSYSDLETYDMAYVSYGDPLRLSIIEALFSDISKIRRFLVTLRTEVDGTTGTWGLYLTLFHSYYFGGEGVREEWANTWSIDFPVNKYCGSHSVPIVAFAAEHWDWSSQYAILDEKVVYLPVDLGNIPSVREIVPTVFELAGMQGWQTPGLYEDYYLHVRIAYICVDVRDKTIWDIASTS